MKKQSLFLFLLVLGGLFLLSTSLSPFRSYVVGDIHSNLRIELPDTYHIVLPGDELWFTTKLIGFEDVGRRDVTLYYEILTGDSEVIVSKSETVAIETQASFVTHLVLPKDIPFGTYFLRASLSSQRITTSTTQVSFQVSSTTIPLKQYLFFGGMTIFVFFLLTFLVYKNHLIQKFLLRRQIKRLVKEKLSS